MRRQSWRPSARGLAPAGYAPLRLAQENGEILYFAPPSVFETLSALERQFAPRIGAPLFFEDDEATRLTPFAGRLFQRGGVTLRESDAGAPIRVIAGIDPAIAERLRRALEMFFPEGPVVEDIVVAEADLPEHGRLAAMPDQVEGPHGFRAVFGIRTSEDPVEVLENVLYGRTAKDDPESSHYAEHMISDGVDKD